MTITQRTRDLLAQRSGGICELCGHNRATNAHHRQARGMGGTRRNIHTIEWLLHLCGQGNTSGCHGHIETHREEAYRNGWLLRRHQRPETTPTWLWNKIFVILTEDGGYEPWGAQGWRMEPATKDTPGAKPEPSSSAPDH